MKPRPLPAVLMLLLFGMSCFLSTPVLSGEHPWDVDRTSGGGHSGPYVPPGSDSTTVIQHSGAYDDQPTNVIGYGSWYGFVSRLTLYWATHHPATQGQGLVFKGKAER